MHLMAEGVGFEPTELSFNGFQDRRLKPLGHPSESLADFLHSPHVGPEHLRDQDRTVSLLEILQNGHKSPPDRQAGTIQGVDVIRLRPVVFPETDGCPARLKILEVAAG